MASRPLDKRLYDEVKNEVRRRVRAWPSAYASGQVVREYKRRGGRYSGDRSSGNLRRWFREDWRNVCERDSSGNYKKCAQDARGTRYPYCRPSRRVSRATPRTIDEMTESQRTRMCRRKQRAEGAHVGSSVRGVRVPAGTRFMRGPGRYKYTAILPDGRKVNFGHRDYEHYRDSVPIRQGGGLWSHLDHGDKRRRDSYRSRHQGVRTGSGERAYLQRYSPAWFSYHYLW